MTDPDFFATIGWSQVGTAIGAVGALGVASFGLVESFGKAFAFSWNGKRIGLPYVGLSRVFRMMKPFEPALLCTYGAEYKNIIAEQYRTNRSQGPCTDTIRQGIRLGMPFLTVGQATSVINQVWNLGTDYSTALATALQVGAAPAQLAPGTLDPATLAGRFATALDARINAAFQDADDMYETWAKSWAALMAILLSLVFNYSMATDPTKNAHGLYPWILALGIGVLAVPLAPVAKDLSTSLQNAVNAFKAVGGKSP